MQNCDGYEMRHIAVGPWGGQCGTLWNDGVYCPVKQAFLASSRLIKNEEEVIISHGNAIESLQITEYDTKGCSVLSEKHGGTGKGYAPAEIAPKDVRQAVSTYGPWGGTGGTLFDDGAYTGVREIHLSRGGGLVSMKVCYDFNGQARWGNKNGGNGGMRTDKITLEYPHEFLTHISGYYGSTLFRGPTVVKSVTFHTNKRKYGPFGDEQGIYFSSGSKDGVIVGFHGRKGWFVDSIGVHVSESKSPVLLRPSYDTFNMIDKRICEAVPAMRKPAPWGGDGGKPWDDGVFSGVKKIFLIRGAEGIYCVQIEYDRNGQSIWSAKHGGDTEGTCHLIQFEYPNEILTCMSGYYGLVGGDDDQCKKVVKSLTFYTNRGRFGPFGEETGTYFTSSKTEGKMVGFRGRAGCYLYAIEVYTQPW